MNIKDYLVMLILSISVGVLSVVLSVHLVVGH